MLREISAVRQDQADLRRRWFQDDYFDLFVWVAPAGGIVAFQLAYDRGGDERVLGWHRSAGYLHRHVDGGEESVFQKMTPLLTRAGRFPRLAVIAQFDARSSGLEEDIRRFVRDKATRYHPFARRARRRRR
jgi:hypothetical protein